MWLCRINSCYRLEILRKSRNSPWTSLLFFFCSRPCTKAKAAPLQETRMRDKFMLHVKGGDGGNGSFSLHKSRRDRFGKPDGGNGGRGGDVIFECSRAVWDFGGLRSHVIACRGGHGSSKNMIGTRGKDKVVQVPRGTVIHLVKGDLECLSEVRSKTKLDPWDLPGNVGTHLEEPSLEAQTSEAQRSESQFESSSPAVKTEPGSDGPEEDHGRRGVAELTEEGQRLVVARGGEGGMGSVTLHSLRSRADGVQSTLTTPTPGAGWPGTEAVLEVELKSIADVGLVGIPNAGKSTLLGALSRAKPAVGHYAFTTLRPNLGRLRFDDFSLTVADIPGLIKGAHRNRGLGHAFLRHIERTQVLAYVVDLSAALDGRRGPFPWIQLRDLILELEHHQAGLSDRPSLVVANKIDELGADQVLAEMKVRVTGVSIYPVCAVLEEGVVELKSALRLLLDGSNAEILNLEKIDCS